MDQEIKQMVQERDEIQQELSNPDTLRNTQRVTDLAKELAKLEKELHIRAKLAGLTKQIREAEDMLAAGTPDLAILARDEIARLQEEKRELEQNMRSQEELPENLIMEIRAGAGGQEAALFAADLFSMYTRFAQKQGWETALLNESKSELEGYKEVVLAINGKGAYQKLHWESGVHRVQRIPATEKTGRIHTSTASVAVLAAAREVDIQIKPQDVKIEFFRSSGPGGQNVNKVETAVRIYHLPTGLIVTSQESRSQQKNREQAMALLRAKLLDAKMQEEQKKTAAARKQQIGTGDRSEKIRTYNFPQDRITDHRIKESWHNIPSFMEGNLEPIVEALQGAIRADSARQATG